MKYWNKSKKTREAHWTKVKRRVITSTSAFRPNITVTWPEMQREHEMKMWCLQQKSKGRFFFKEGNPTWYFEHEKDATWFLLTWG